mmetsp:Transcript_5345/g.9582  ORF Transcript_5345/g.9582 Transcript_5345/m.9582 type:complete len:354 (-) Transcript_5345:115-1176(-)
MSVRGHNGRDAKGPLPRSPAGQIPRVARNDAKASQKAKAALEEHGAVIFEDAATVDELKSGEALFWEWLQNNTPAKIDKDKPESFQDHKWNQLCFPKNGVCSKFGIGQSEFMWHCRLLPGVRGAFESVWGTKDLITSFDGWGAYRNPWYQGGNKSWITSGGWFHIDQSFHNDPGLTSYQAILNFYPATASTGSTVLVLGSHKEFKGVFKGERYIKRVRQNTVDYVKVTRPEDYGKYLTRARQAVLKPGDLLMWDSRVIHCAQGIDYNAGVSAVMPGRESEPLARLVSYITMVPRDHSSHRKVNKRKVKAARRRYVENGLTSGHNPVLTVPLKTSIKPETYKVPDKDSPIWDLV